jgi:hypothetical protein
MAPLCMRRLMANTLVTFGEPGGTRTRDPLIKSQMLYHLSYRPSRGVALQQS